MAYNVSSLLQAFQRCFHCDVLTLWHGWKVNINSKTFKTIQYHRHKHAHLHTQREYWVFNESFRAYHRFGDDFIEVNELARTALMSSESHNVISMKLLHILHMIHWLIELQVRSTATHLLFIHACENFKLKKRSTRWNFSLLEAYQLPSILSGKNMRHRTK